MEWVAHWDQGAWGTFLGGLGTVVTTFALFYAVRAARSAATASERAAAAVQAATAERAASAIDRLMMFERQLIWSARLDNSLVATFAFAEGTHAIREALGLLGTLTLDGEMAAGVAQASDALLSLLSFIDSAEEQLGMPNTTVETATVQLRREVRAVIGRTLQTAVMLRVLNQREGFVDVGAR